MPSWEAVAHLLGQRMQHQGHDCECEPIDPDGCPSCQDRLAFAAYLAKCRASGRVPHVNAPLTGEAVSIEQVRGR